MTILKSHIKRAICAGIFKVLYNSNVKWNELKVQPIATVFTSVSNPTTWSTFFAEAVGTAIQQEFVLRGSYCPDLEEELLDQQEAGKTWEDLETWIKDNVRALQTPL